MVLAGNRWTPLEAFAVLDVFTGLTSHWRMDESSGNRIDWQDTNTLSSNGVTQANGPIGIGAALLTRAEGDYLSAAHSASLSLDSRSYGYCGWLYLTSTSNTEEFVLDKTGPSGGAQLRKINADSNGRLEYTHTDSAGASTVVRSVSGTQNTAGVWYFVLFGYDVVTQTCYLWSSNAAGVLQAEEVSAGGVLAAGADTSTLYFGAENGSSNFLGGRLCNWSFYRDRSFTQAQAEELFNSNVPLLYPPGVIPAEMTGAQQTANPHLFGATDLSLSRFYLYTRGGDPPAASQPNFCTPSGPLFGQHYSNTDATNTDKVRMDSLVPWNVSTTLGARPASCTVSSAGTISDKGIGDKDYIWEAPGIFTLAVWFQTDVNNADRMFLDTVNLEFFRNGFALLMTPSGNLRFVCSNAEYDDWGFDATSSFTIPANTPVCLVARSDGTVVDLGIFNPLTAGTAALTMEDSVDTFHGTRGSGLAFNTMVYGNKVAGPGYQVTGFLWDSYFFNGRRLNDTDLYQACRYKPGLIRNPQAVAPLVWWDPADWQRTFVTSAKLVNCTPNDPIGALENTSSAGTYDLTTVDANRPTMTEDVIASGMHYGVPLFDGTDDFLTADALAALVTGTDQPFVITFGCMRNASGSGTRTLFSFAHSSGTGKHEIRLNASNQIESVRTDDAGTTVTVTGTSAIPVYAAASTPIAVVTVLFTGTACTIRVGGAVEANAISQNVGATTLNQFTQGCSRAAANSNFAAFSFHGGFFDTAFTANEIDYLEDFITRMYVLQTEIDDPDNFSGPPE